MYLFFILLLTCSDSNNSLSITDEFPISLYHYKDDLLALDQCSENSKKELYTFLVYLFLYQQKSSSDSNFFLFLEEIILEPFLQHKSSLNSQELDHFFFTSELDELLKLQIIKKKCLQDFINTLPWLKKLFKKTYQTKSFACLTFDQKKCLLSPQERSLFYKKQKHLFKNKNINSFQLFLLATHNYLLKLGLNSEKYFNFLNIDSLLFNKLTKKCLTKTINKKFINQKLDEELEDFLRNL